ncbi:AP endonuclease [Hahella sp. CCB-MM4]|nr:AP endonuclease [Hahella sp. CCB-MM4]
MSISLTCAPCCWGVDDISNPHLPAWTQVLDEAAKAGFQGLELGPYGYMPLDVGVLSSALRDRGLSIVAGTIFDDLVSITNRDQLLRQTDEICGLLSQLPRPQKTRSLKKQPIKHGEDGPQAPYLTVMDWGHDERDFAAGHSDRAPRLDSTRWQNLIDNIRAISELARDKYNIRAVIHPHAGGYIEFEDELAKIVEDIHLDTAGLCLDTGHLLYAGMDPREALSRYWQRVDYIHFKDIDAQVYAEVMKEDIRFFDACAKGVMCAIGQGAIDYPAIRSFLAEKGYRGYITIEQERDPRNAGSILRDLTASRNYLLQTGF